MADIHDAEAFTEEYARLIASAIRKNSPEDGDYTAKDLLREFAYKIWKHSRYSFAEEIERLARR